MATMHLALKPFFLLPNTPAFWDVQHNVGSLSNGLFYMQNSELSMSKSLTPVNMHLGCVKDGKWANNILPVVI